jgi:hypothetical protein
MSNALVNSLLAGDNGEDIRSRHRHAREIRSRIDSQDLLLQLEQLAFQLQELGKVINTSLLLDSNSVVGKLFAAVDGIVWKTAEASSAFLRRVFEISTKPKGCWSELISHMQQFVKLAESLQGRLENESPDEPDIYTRTFSAYIAFNLGLKFNMSTFQLPSLINDSVTLCNLQKNTVTLASRLMVGENRCDRESFCSKFAKVQWQLAEQVKRKIEESFRDKHYTNFVDVVDWLQQLANRSGESYSNLTEDGDKEVLVGREVVNGGNVIRSIYANREPSTFKIPKCYDDMDKWRSNVAAWLNEASLYNDSGGFSTTSTINSKIRLVATPKRILQQLSDLITNFWLGKITQVSG